MNATLKTVVGVDTAKSVFQVYTVEQATGEVINKPIKRGVRPSNWPRWNGCPGLTTTACWNRSAVYRQPKLRQTITSN